MEQISRDAIVAVKLDQRITGIVNPHTRTNAECFVRDCADAINDYLDKGMSSSEIADKIISHMKHEKTAWIQADLVLRIGLDDADAARVNARLKDIYGADKTSDEGDRSWHARGIQRRIDEHGGLPPSMWYPGG